MKKTIIAISLALLLSLACLTGCTQSASDKNTTSIASGGVLLLSVNPEIAVEYDENGIVSAVTARNDDAAKIIGSCGALIGQEAKTAVKTLVTEIGKAGYFIEDVDGQGRRITLEIEAGSSLPHSDFLDEVVSGIRQCIDENKWHVPMDVENESDYGITDYDSTDYDDTTDYDDATDYDDVTDYDDATDYGKATDYDDATDYGKATDYDDATDYGKSTDYDDVTDYDDTTDYGTDYDNDSAYDDESDYGTDYDTTDYDDNSDYGNSDYDD